MPGLALFILRLALAAVFVAHGAHTLFGVWATPGVGPGGVTSMGAFYASLGLEPGVPLAAVAGATQLFCGFLLGIGFLTRPASVALATYIGVGVWKVHMHWGFFLNWMGVGGRREGLEYSVVLGGALLCLLVAGAGPWSLDGRASRGARAAGSSPRARGR